MKKQMILSWVLFLLLVFSGSAGATITQLYFFDDTEGTTKMLTGTGDMAFYHGTVGNQHYKSASKAYTDGVTEGAPYADNTLRFLRTPNIDLSKHSGSLYASYSIWHQLFEGDTLRVMSCKDATTCYLMATRECALTSSMTSYYFTIPQDHKTSTWHLRFQLDTESDNADGVYIDDIIISDDQNANMTAVNALGPPTTPWCSGGCPDGPDLEPKLLSGWDNKIIPSKVTGTRTSVTEFTTSDTIYVDYNCGNTDASQAVSGTWRYGLYLNDTRIKYFERTADLAAGSTSYISDSDIGTLSAGTHSLKVVCDYDSNIGEDDETNNSYTRSSITVTSDSTGTWTLTATQQCTPVTQDDGPQSGGCDYDPQDPPKWDVLCTSCCQGPMGMMWNIVDTWACIEN